MSCSAAPPPMAGAVYQLAAGPSAIIPSVDCETYSEAGFIMPTMPGEKVRGAAADGKGGLGVVGTPVYASHPSTEILCLYYDLKDGQGRQPWLPAAPSPAPLLAHIAAGGLIEAWNITFEFWIWNMVCARRFGWPVLRLDQCRCAMAKSRRYGLPGGLDNAAKVLGTPRKDSEGKRLIQKLTRPHTPTKKRTAPRWTPATAWDDFVRLYDYCGNDVVAEDAASARTPDLTASELAIWKADQTVNARGIRVDTDSLAACLDILGQSERRFTLELVQITAGAVGAVSKRDDFMAWLHSRGVPMPNMQAATVTDFLAGNGPPLPPDCRRALEIRDILGSANVKKLRTLKLQVSSDGRLRDQYTYCGAAATSRWSAGGVQLQNITGKGPKTAECEGCGQAFGVGDHLLEPPDGGTPRCPRCGSFMWHDLPEWSMAGVEAALADIATRDLDHVLRVWGDPIAVLCGCLRGLFTARPGYELICVDYTAVEAVVLACLARCQWRIDAFIAGRDIYLSSASQTTGIPYEEYAAYRAEHGVHHAHRKPFKIKELALGFSGWIGAVRAFGGGEGQDDAELKAEVLAWRDASPEIVELWGGQYRRTGPRWGDWRAELFGLEGAAIQAVMFPGQRFELTQCDVSYEVRDDVLWCTLPSGRRLYYHKPRLVAVEDRMRRGPSWALSVEQWNSNPAKGAVGWHRQELWVGILVENIVQAVARDLQAGALVRCESVGYPVVAHTHDELTAEVPIGVGSVEHMGAVMSEPPAWASWWPIKAAGWRGVRYRKD